MRFLLHLHVSPKAAPLLNQQVLASPSKAATWSRIRKLFWKWQVGKDKEHVDGIGHFLWLLLSISIFFLVANLFLESLIQKKKRKLGALSSGSWRVCIQLMLVMNTTTYSHCWRSTVATGRTIFPSLKIFQISCRVSLKPLKEPNEIKDLSYQWGWCFQRRKNNPWFSKGSLWFGTSLSLCFRSFSNASGDTMGHMLTYCAGCITGQKIACN